MNAACLSSTSATLATTAPPDDEVTLLAASHTFARPCNASGRAAWKENAIGESNEFEQQATQMQLECASSTDRCQTSGADV